MADNSNTLQLILQVKDDGTVVIDKTTGKIKGLEDQTQKGASGLDSFNQGWVGLTARIAAFTAAGYGAYRTLGSFISTAAEAEQIENRLQFALENVGHEWSTAKSAVDDFANSIQETTRFSDEQARQALTDMMMYTQDFGKAQMGAKLAMDMSVRTGQDLHSTSRLIGMAMSGNVEMLGRYIPELRNLDARLGENATQAEKTEYTFKLLQKKFSGTAQSDVNSYAGQVAQLKNEFGDLQKTIGNFLIGPAIAIVKFFKEGAIVADNFFKAMSGKKEENIFLIRLKEDAEEVRKEIMNLEEQQTKLFEGDPRLTRSPWAEQAISERIYHQKEFLQYLEEQIRLTEEANKAALSGKENIPDENKKLAASLRETQIEFHKLVQEAQNLSEAGKMPSWEDSIWTYPERGIPDIEALNLEFNKLLAEVKRLSEEGKMPSWEDSLWSYPERTLVDVRELDLKFSKLLAEAELLSDLGQMPSWQDSAENLRSFKNQMEDPSLFQGFKVGETLARNMASAWDFNLKKIVTDSESAGDAAKNVFYGMADSFASAVSRMISDWIMFGNVTGKYKSGEGLIGLLGTGLNQLLSRGAAANSGISKAYQYGGWITEPIYGIGRSGRRYTLGEAGPEVVTPANRAAEPSIVIHIENKTGAEIKQTETSVFYDGRQWVKNVMLELAVTDPDIRNAYGSGRR